MATIQPKITNGHKYWYIVESRRVNGKPRPVVLEYLGKADDLLKRLQSDNDYKLKSYSHGHTASLLDLCEKLGICSIINEHAESQRSYFPDMIIRNNLTVGGTLMLAIISRACSPTSKRDFSNWAKRTSLPYMLGISTSKVDSQHFWDMMDCMPPEAIVSAEAGIVKKVSSLFELDTDSILYDTTNYFTFIDTENKKADIAKRGKNKQKRNDLRQVGLALAVTRKDMIPVYHHSYEGNMADSTVFKNVLKNIVDRMASLGLDISSQTMVFDKGVNSKINLDYVRSLGLNFVGALSPSHNKGLVSDAEHSLLELGDGAYYRTRRTIWGIDMTAVVYVSNRLSIGVIRNIYANVEKCDSEIAKMNSAVDKPRARKKTSKQLTESVQKLLKAHNAANFISFNILDGDKPYIDHSIDYESFAKAEDDAGIRIIMTTRHEWSAYDIVNTYFGQASIEESFKNMKATHHMTLRPQYHWTTQKIRVHNFCCVMGYLLNALLYKQARENAKFAGSMSTFLEILDNVRLGSVIQNNGKRKKSLNVKYSVEIPEEPALPFIDLFKLDELITNKPKIAGLSKY